VHDVIRSLAPESAVAATLTLSQFAWWLVAGLRAWCVTCRKDRHDTSQIFLRHIPAHSVSRASWVVLKLDAADNGVTCCFQFMEYGFTQHLIRIRVGRRESPQYLLLVLRELLIDFDPCFCHKKMPD
jgi:hypothetical protein